MTAASLITLRETLETSLIVGIILACVDRTDRRDLKPLIWLAVGCGVAISAVLGIVLYRFFSFDHGSIEPLLEGTTMLIATALLTSAILWMLRQRSRGRDSLTEATQQHIEHRYVAGLFMLTLLSTLREGIETVIFLQASLLHTRAHAHLVGAALGIALAIAMSTLLFRGIIVLRLRTFFSVTSALLILFGASLLAHGIHELIEIGLLSPMVKHLWHLPTLSLPSGFAAGGHFLGRVLSGVPGLQSDHHCSN